MCAFNNLMALAGHLVKLNEDVIILCSGNNNLLSLEDSVCAGKLISKLIKENKEIILSDSSKGALALFKSFGKDIRKMLGETEHGQLLINNGFKDDLTLCAELNSTDVIPYLTGNVLKVLR